MRTLIIFATICIMFGFLAARLTYLQLFISNNYKKQAVRQHYYELTLPAQRGEIRASDLSDLVINKPDWLVYAEPKNIKDKIGFSRSVTAVLDISPESVISMISEEGKYWVPLFKKADFKEKEALEIQKIPGLGFEKNPSRYYPESSMAGQLLGFIGSDQNGQDVGYFGVEGYYDRQLRGKDGLLMQERDARGMPIVLGTTRRIEAQNGRTLVLWLDKTIQYITEKKLKNGIEKYGAKSGSVVVMNPKTGGVLASASYPDYNPAQYYLHESSVYKNPVVSESYEPGSTFKVLMMAAGIEEGRITPDTQIDEVGPVKIGAYQIRTWDNKYRGRVTMTDVLVHSSNVGMVYIAKTLGKDKVLEYLHNFGFGKLTGIDLQEESSSQLRADTDWKEIDLATVAFGQGIAVTPIQMVTAVSAIANGGVIMRPRVVKEIYESDGEVISVKPEKMRRVISPATAHIMTEMMVTTVEKGESKWAKPKGYRIAGKTGTAQIPVAGHYDDKKTIASFVGFAPADDPVFAILVTLREPTSSPWGSETAAPLFFEIAKEIFNYYGITQYQ